ncbi:hypothetical protein KCU73_g7290, partial [Aureobasidium melanogenum]
VSTMQPFFIIFCFSLFLAVQSLVIEQRSCVSPDVITIAQQVSHPHYFCAWYLSDGRTRSPIPGINTNALLDACKCVVSAEPVGTNAKTLAAIAEAARLHSFVSATCPSTPSNPISKEFENPSSFCAFFHSYERHDSPIPNLNVPADFQQDFLEQTFIIDSDFSSQNLDQIFVHQGFRQQGLIYESDVERTILEEIIFSEVFDRQNVVEQDKHHQAPGALKQDNIIHDLEHQGYCLINIQLKDFLKITSVHSEHLFVYNINFCYDIYVFGIFDTVEVSNIFFIFDYQPYGSAWANATDQYKLYCNSYDIEGFEMYDYWIGMWGSIRQCDARAACTGVKCHGDYCMLYFGPLTLVPASSGSVALRVMPDAYEMITSNDLEAFCTTYLGYTTPSITKTTTFFANATNTAIFNLTATSTIAALTTKTDFVETITVISTINASRVPVPIKKRALETPMELDYYSGNEISSGCSRAATQPMKTTVLETMTISSTEDVATTTTAVEYKNITSIITELATSTTTVFINATSPTLSSATCTPTPKVDAEQQAKDLIALDFLFSHNNLTSMLSTFPMSMLGVHNLTGDVLPPIQRALQNWVPCTTYNVSTELLACKDETYSISFVACIIFRTSPYALKSWPGPGRPVPVSGLTRTYTNYMNKVVGIDGVPITPDMSLIEAIDHSTQGGHYQARDFRNMQYYFGEIHTLV